MSILIIADDLTGAADCAVAFSATRARSLVLLADDLAVTAGDDCTLAIDADTRRLAPSMAASRVLSIHARLKGEGRRLYQKMDSTLRGNWATEVAALQLVAGTAIVAPAHPEVGRVVCGGHVYVRGEPLETTQIWARENAHRPAGIEAQLLEAGLKSVTLDADDFESSPHELAVQIGKLVSQRAPAVIVNARSRKALRVLAAATVSLRGAFFWVGSGGLAQEIAALHPGGGPGAETASVVALGPVLVVVGSPSQVSDRQCATLKACCSVEEIVVAPHVLRDGPSHPAWITLQTKIGQVLEEPKDLLVRIDSGVRFDACEGPQLATALASLIGPCLSAVTGIVATGGETARAILTEARIECLEVLYELEAGVVVSRPFKHGNERAPIVVTKAGAFGSDRALLDAWTRLRVVEAHPLA